MFDKLDEKFDVVPTQKEEIVVAEKVDDIEDTEKARDTLHNLIDKGSDAIDDILNIAKNSEHPRAYEVAAQMIKTVSDVAKDLVEVKKKMHDMDKKSSSSIKTQNNVFVGSTHELMKMLKSHQVEEIRADE